MKPFFEMIPYFEANSYKCPTEQNNGVIQFARGTELPLYDYWSTLPGVRENFNAFMTEVRAARPSWLEWFPMEQEILAGATDGSDTPIIVDIGGGRGHDLKLQAVSSSEKPFSAARSAHCHQR